MDLVKFSIKEPVSVAVIVILIILFGLIGLNKIPYQLTPTVVEPEISVSTNWVGATPYEIEKDILEPQERVLKGIVGLEELESSAYNGYGRINLKFKLGISIDEALLRVTNQLNEVRSYPLNADKPVIRGTGASTSPVIWMVLKTKDENLNHIDTYKTYFEEELKQKLERVEGVADLFIRSGALKEVQIELNYEKLNSYKLSVKDVITKISGENSSISAGSYSLGRRDYRIRTVGEYNSLKDMEEIVLLSTGTTKVLLKDVATVKIGYAKNNSVMKQNGDDGIGVGVVPQSGANILDMTNRVEEVVKELNQKIAKDGIYFEWVNDQRPYILNSIALVKDNILVGAILAIAVLLLFLGSFASTISVALAIPISVIGTFFFLDFFGRTLNVISLAGISFAVGMLVDNAIVVLENIDRHRKMGKNRFDASYDGAKEVAGAIIISTLTTIAVFLPIIFIEQEAGQLFKDIAIAITCSIIISLFVSISVIPALTNKIFSQNSKNRDTFIKTFGYKLHGLIMFFYKISMKNIFTKLFTIISLTSLSIYLSYSLFPKMEYLPQGNRNFIINMLVTPPGFSKEEREIMGKHIHNQLKDYIGVDELNGIAGIKSLLFISSDTFSLFTIVSSHEERAKELIPILKKVANSYPGVFGTTSQAGVFERRIRSGRSIDVDISGSDLDSLINSARAVFGAISKDINGVQIRPQPSLEVLYPEINFIPNRENLTTLGLSSSELGVIIDVLNDGRKIDEYKQEGTKKIDLVLKNGVELTPEEIYNTQIVAKNELIPIKYVATLQNSYGLTELRHLETKRTITLQVTPPRTITIQETMEQVSEIVANLKSKNIIKDETITLGGNADKLSQISDILKWNFVLAVVITYLLMSALFGNFLYPLIILFTIPLSAGGGLLGLKLTNLYVALQPLDILTMLGFIILVGVVVNNAILIVHQALNNIRYEKMEHNEAIRESVSSRIRPIFMSSLTSLFGMLPLVISDGSGSEMYRGLGSVLLGGLTLSTIFTLFIIPALLSFVIKMEKVSK